MTSRFGTIVCGVSVHRVLVRAALAIASAALPFGCDATNDPQTGVISDSNTNWLTCNNPTPCGEELTCLCGLCTQPCTDDSDCSSMDDGVCLPQRNVEACGATAPATNVCMPVGTPVTEVDAGLQAVDAGSPAVLRASASSSSLVVDETNLLFNPPEQAIDGAAETRWSSGKPQAGNEWFEVDLGESRTISKVTLELGLGSAVESMGDWPRGYSLSVSDESMNFGAPVIAQGAGSTPTTVIDFAPHTGRFLLIRQTVVSDAWWSIHELTVE